MKTFTTTEAALLLGVTRQQVVNMIKAGRLYAGRDRRGYIMTEAALAEVKPPCKTGPKGKVC